jgi:hypothetical protein
MVFGEIPIPGAAGVSLVLLVAAFCRCWFERCRRKSFKEIEAQRHEERLELLQEYGKLLSAGELTADDLLLIARLERVEPQAELDPAPDPSPVHSGVVPFAAPAKPPTS